MARPLAALRGPPRSSSRHCSPRPPGRSHHTPCRIRATPPRAQRAATPRPPPRRPDAETPPRPAHPPAPLPARLARSLSTLSLTVCPVKTLPGSRVPTTANPLSSLPPPRLRAPVAMATPPPPRAPELEFGGPLFPGEGGVPQRTRDPQGPPALRTHAATEPRPECTRVTWEMSPQGLPQTGR